MTWKQFVRRFKEMMADTSTAPLGVTDLEAWHRKQKQRSPGGRPIRRRKKSRARHHNLALLNP